jgi:hypothetical protein
MKRNLLSIVLVCLAISSFGQIVITNDDIAPVGTTVFMASDTLPSAEIIPGDAGANKTWDFSNVTAHSIDTLDLVLPSATPYEDEFPESNFAMSLASDSIFIYMTRNEDKLARTGMAITLPAEEDPSFWHINPEDILLDFPVSYQNSYNETYVINSIIASPQPGADSIWLKDTYDKETNIDAWGTLIIPMGNFNVLRQRVDEIETDSIFAKMMGNWMFISATIDTSVTYSWWTDDVNVGFSLFSFDVDPASGDVDGSVSFMNSLPVGLHEIAMIESKAFPNPVSDVLNIEFKEAQSGELTLYNQVGQLVRSQKLNHQNHVQLQISQLPAGMYLYKISNTSGEVVSSGKVTKR